MTVIRLVQFVAVFAPAPSGSFLHRPDTSSDLWSARRNGGVLFFQNKGGISGIKLATKKTGDIIIKKAQFMNQSPVQYIGGGRKCIWFIQNPYNTFILVRRPVWLNLIESLSFQNSEITCRVTHLVFKTSYRVKARHSGSIRPESDIKALFF